MSDEVIDPEELQQELRKLFPELDDDGIYRAFRIWEAVTKMAKTEFVGLDARILRDKIAPAMQAACSLMWGSLNGSPLWRAN